MYDDVDIAPPRLNDPAIFDALPDFLKTTINRERYFWRWNTDEKYQTNMRAYYRMVSGIDGAIGRFIDGAGRSRVWPTTRSSSTPPTTVTTWAIAAWPASGRTTKNRFACR